MINLFIVSFSVFTMFNTIVYFFFALKHAGSAALVTVISRSLYFYLSALTQNEQVNKTHDKLKRWMDEWSEWNSEHFSHISLKLNRHSTRIANSLSHLSVTLLSFFSFSASSHTVSFSNTRKSLVSSVLLVFWRCAWTCSQCSISTVVFRSK